MQMTTHAPLHTPKGLTRPCPVAPSNTKKLRTGSSLPPIAFRTSCPRIPPTMAQLGAYSNPCTVAIRLGEESGGSVEFAREGWQKKEGTHSISSAGNNSTDTPSSGSSFWAACVKAAASTWTGVLAREVTGPGVASR